MNRVQHHFLKTRFTWYFVFCFGLIWLPGSVNAQSVQEIISQIETLVATEDVAALVDMAADPLDIAAFGPSKTYSHTQGTFVLQEIFRSLDVRSFSIADHAVSDNGLFIQGDIGVAPSERPVRMYLRLKKSASRWSIRELLFERKDQ